MGRDKNPTICNSENLRYCSQILQKNQIYCGDFTQCEKWVNSQTFVYFDPPYRPLSTTANFNSYAQQNFDNNEQIRLRDFYRKLDSKGAKLMLSNSDPKNQNITDNFFELAYQDYKIKTLKAKRYINSKSTKRGEINELLILNY